MEENAVWAVFRVVDLTGVLLNGVLGGKLARQKHFDAVGFMILAVMSAMGGGIVRDVILQHGPPVAITDPFYIGTALVGASIAFLWRLDSRGWRIALILADGLVLGSWAATGAMKTLSMGFGLMPALLLGLTTAVGGGMIRDISAGNVPTVLGGNYLYATPALVSAGIMVAFFNLGYPMWGMIVATVVGSSFTALAHWRRWRLPEHTDWTLTLSSEQLRYLLDRKAAARKRTRTGLDESFEETGLPRTDEAQTRDEEG
ncbi:trimeric intracellular cation channel family protein [Scrofimicrobium sp. R131]|uniref:Trimeric intracellular cation channel family protein n=1 Tax=Scrofimicrobium appendicitidis TaxID=3079930 RepID=A0AAU7V6R3_9ACTO